MYKKISKEIVLILVMAAFLTVPSSVVQFLHAQSDQGLQAVLNIHNDERKARWKSATHLERQPGSRGQELG